MNCYVLLIGVEVADALDRDQAQLSLDPGAHMLPAALKIGFGCQLLGHLPGDARGMLEGFLETFAAHGLQNVANSTRLKGVNRVLIIVGCEHNGGRRSHRVQMMRSFDAIDAGHANVEQYNVGIVRDGH